MSRLMDKAQQVELAARYDASIRRIKKWLLIGAGTLAIALVLWKVVVPLLPQGLHNEASFLSITVLGLGGYAVFASLILWAVFSREKKRRLGESGRLAAEK